MALITLGIFTLNWKDKQPLETLAFTVRRNRAYELLIRETPILDAPVGQFVCLIPLLEENFQQTELGLAGKYYPKGVDMLFHVGVSEATRFNNSALSILLYPCGYRPNLEQPTERTFEVFWDDDVEYRLGEHP